jgi:hypothetical protein
MGESSLQWLLIHRSNLTAPAHAKASRRGAGVGKERRMFYFYEKNNKDHPELSS